MPLRSEPIFLKTIQLLWNRFCYTSRRLPASVWWQWGKTLLVGLGLCAIFTFAMTRLAMGWQAAGLESWDRHWLTVLRQYSPISFAQGITWQSPGNLVGMLPVFFALTALTTWFRQPLVAATAFAAYLGQFALVWISWGMWSRDRPDLIAEGIAAPSLHSFPSGHVVVVTTMYGLIFYLWFRASRNRFEKLGVIVFATLWVGLIALSRLALGAHWPSDVIAGGLIGLLWLFTVVLALERSQQALRRSCHSVE